MNLTEKAKRLIDEKNFANVATLMPDGSPQVTPMWVDRDGDTILLNNKKSRQRTRNLTRDPRVAIAVYDQNSPYVNTSIRGKVIEITEKGAEEHIDKLSMKYYGTPKYPRHDPKDPQVIMRVEATHIHESG
jgi:PPOX class probable F420-dependent enzyme